MSHILSLLSLGGQNAKTHIIRDDDKFSWFLSMKTRFWQCC